MQLRSYCEKVVKEKPATKRVRNKEKARLYSKAYRERIKLNKKQTEDKLKNSSDGDPTSLIEGLSMQQLHATNLDPVCPIPMTLEKNSQMQLQPAALDSQQNQLTVYPNWQVKINSFVVHLSVASNILACDLGEPGNQQNLRFE
jgi:hypothetical protein